MKIHQGKRNVPVGIFVLIATIIVNAANVLARGNPKLAAAPRGTVKTTKDIGGQVVDCVDIYKQPAFDHPLLKDHTLELKPSFMKEYDGQGSGLEGWGIDCPKGTVPIVRKTLEDGPKFTKRSPLFLTDGKGGDNNNSFVDQNQFAEYHDYAVMKLMGARREFHGGHARHNVWNPSTDLALRAVSISQIWVTGGPPENQGLESIEAGWITGYKFAKTTKFFTFWTHDGYRTGCYNLDCQSSGYVQIHQSIAPGLDISPVSKINGDQAELDIIIRQDSDSNKWWLVLNGQVIGYWPPVLFSYIQSGANSIQWGGEVAYFTKGPRGTRTQMGSGRFPRDGLFAYSSFIRNITYSRIVGTFEQVPSQVLDPTVSDRNCYDLGLGPVDTLHGTNFYFGGPGCPP